MSKRAAKPQVQVVEAMVGSAATTPVQSLTNEERELRAQARAAEGLHALAAALRDVGLALVAGGRQAPKPEASKPEAPKPEAPKPEVKAEAPKAEAPKAEAPKQGSKTPEFADVRKSIVALAGAKTSDVAFQVLRKFGVEAISDLKPEQYAGVIAAADAAREAK